MSGHRKDSIGSSGVTRRALLGGAALAAGAVAFKPMAPFISNAEAAATT